MKKYLLTLWLTVAFALCLSAEGIPDMKFRRLDTRDGLSNSQLLCIMRDTRGIVWFGTPYGLNRYDGFRIKTFYSYAKDTTTLRNNYIDELYEAHDGRFWIKQGMNYTIFDPVTERADRHPENWLHQHGIKGSIERLYIDSDKDLWVKTLDHGLWHYAPATGKVKNYPPGYGPQDFMAGAGVSGFAEYGNNLYISTSNGEVLCFDKKADRIVLKENSLFKGHYTRDQDCKLRIDDQGFLWMITINGVYVCHTSRVGQWYHSLNEVLAAWGIRDVPETMSVWDVNYDRKGRLWIGTDHSGLYILDRKQRHFRQFMNNKYDDTSVSGNTLRVIYRDQQGRMWVGSYMNGVNLYTENLSNFINIDLGNINTLCADRAGYYWLGTNDNGIIRYDPRTQEEVIYNKANSGIGSNVMVSSLAATDGSVWFGTYEGGLIRIKDGHVTTIRATGDTTSLASNNVWTLYEAPDRYIWIGTLGGGVQRMDPNTLKMRTINMANSPIPSDYISYIAPTKRNWLMVAHSRFYSLVDPQRFKVYNRNLKDNGDGIDITDVSICGLEDSRGLVWQGSSSGATIWDPQHNHVYLLDMRSGFMGSTVNSLAEDKNHVVWVATDHGVSKVIPRLQDDGRYSFAIKSYNNRDGLQTGPYNQRSMCFTADGLLLVGGTGGLDIINPQKVGAGHIDETPIFIGLKVFEREVEPTREFDGRVILEQTLDRCDELNLSYSDRQFTIQLATNSGELHNTSRFVYKLIGFNEEWVSTDEINPNVTYMGLPSGSYTLCARMLNDDGTYGDIESRLDINIAPPFYRSWWAYLFYVLLLVAGIWLWRNNFLRMQEKQMEVDNFRRETEKLQWMNEMRRQMTGAGSMADEDRPVRKEDITLRKTDGDLVSCAGQCCEQFRKPKDKKVDIRFNSTVETLVMPFDHQQLTQALQILLGNSVRFCPHDCRIQVSVFAQKDTEVKILVADNGVGIKDEYKAHVFDHMMMEGGELGLDRVKAIVDAHEGSITVENNPGGGSVFIITLPTGREEEILEAELVDD